MKERTNGVCGVRRVSDQRRKPNEWWSEEVGVDVADRRRAFEECYKEEIGLHMIDTRHRKRL